MDALLLVLFALLLLLASVWTRDRVAPGAARLVIIITLRTKMETTVAFRPAWLLPRGDPELTGTRHRATRASPRNRLRAAAAGAAPVPRLAIVLPVLAILAVLG